MADEWQILVRDWCSSKTIAAMVSPLEPVEGLIKAVLRRTCAGSESCCNTGWGLLHNGRQLPGDLQIIQTSISDGSTAQLVGRVLGGGGDGGSTGAESRSCYLEMYAQKKADKVDPAQERLARWTRCQISGERLLPPCVCDHLGSLFNKDSVVHALLNKTVPASLSHISGLKCLVNLKLEPSPHQPSSSSGSRQLGSQETADFCCPLSGVEMNGRFRFVVHTPTGVVLSEKALKDAPQAVEELIGGPYCKDDLLPLVPSEEELEVLRERLRVRLEAERKKKSKKGKNGGQQEGRESDTQAVKRKPDIDADDPAEKKLKVVEKYMPKGATKEVFASLFVTSQS